MHCGNEIAEHDNEDGFLAEIFYNILNRNTSAIKPLKNRVDELLGKYMISGDTEKAFNISVQEFIASESIDFHHSRYVNIQLLLSAISPQ